MDNHRNCTYYAEFHNTKWLRMGCLQWYNRTKNTYRNFLFIDLVILIVILLIVGLCSCKDIKKCYSFPFLEFFSKNLFIYLVVSRKTLSLYRWFPVASDSSSYRVLFLYDSCLQKYFLFCDNDPLPVGEGVNRLANHSRTVG